MHKRGTTDIRGHSLWLKMKTTNRQMIERTYNMHKILFLRNSNDLSKKNNNFNVCLTYEVYSTVSSNKTIISSDMKSNVDRVNFFVNYSTDDKS